MDSIKKVVNMQTKSIQKLMFPVILGIIVTFMVFCWANTGDGEHSVNERIAAIGILGTLLIVPSWIVFHVEAHKLRRIDIFMGLLGICLLTGFLVFAVWKSNQQHEQVKACEDSNGKVVVEGRQLSATVSCSR